MSLLGSMYGTSHCGLPGFLTHSLFYDQGLKAENNSLCKVVIITAFETLINTSVVTVSGLG